MSELKIFVDVNENTTGKVVICQENATKLGISSGASVEIENPDNNTKTSGTVEISNMVLDFAAQISKNIIDQLQFSGVELIIRPMSSTGLVTPKLQIPKVPTPQPIPQQQPQTPPGLTPLPTPPPKPTPQPTYTPPPQPTPTPQPTYTPPPQPTPTPQPTYTPPPPMQPPVPGQDYSAQAPTAEPYPNRIDVHMLQSQKAGIILTPVIDNAIEGGRVQLNSTVIH
ncbi:MAG: hypothetical protein ACFFDX_10780, partial [Candidatus Odinarchaeota archaeon]